MIINISSQKGLVLINFFKKMVNKSWLISCKNTTVIIFKINSDYLVDKYKNECKILLAINNNNNNIFIN